MNSCSTQHVLSRVRRAPTVVLEIRKMASLEQSLMSLSALINLFTLEMGSCDTPRSEVEPDMGETARRRGEKRVRRRGARSR